MATGGGKYDDECTVLRHSTEAECAIAIVIGGNKGEGFSVQSTNPQRLHELVALLRGVADEIEIDMSGTKR